MIDVNLNLLKFFIVTAESKSIAEAGEKLGYSHSTVSENIRTLEKQFGVKLFTRKPLKLTDVGKEIYETVKRGFTDIDFAMLIADSKNNIEYLEKVTKDIETGKSKLQEHELIEEE